MPPEPVSCTEYADPTAPANWLPVVVTAGVAGIVSVIELVFVPSATEVAVMEMVCAALVAAGAVKVTEVAD
jgi:hypothetical protein